MSEKLLSTKEVFHGRSVILIIDEVEKDSGIVTSREIVKHVDCIAVVPVDNENRVILVKQYRRPVDKVLLEIPAGGIEDGEEPVQCVIRELQEEIGYKPGKVIKIGGIYSAPGYCTEYLHLFLAKDLKQSRLIAEDTDEIEVVRVPLNEIPGLIQRGDICDAKSVSALLSVILNRF
jgi:ADP-ribose pyrophosphatase